MATCDKESTNERQVTLSGVSAQNPGSGCTFRQELGQRAYRPELVLP
jgi:hypothetical protein